MTVRKAHREILRKGGNQKVILFTHGIYGSPNQFDYVADYFFCNGYDCRAVILPGHGRDVASFCRSRPTDYKQFLEDCVQKLKKQYQKVILVGHSMGGLLSILACANDGADGLVLFNTPLRPKVGISSWPITLQVIFGKQKNDTPCVQTYRKAMSIDLKNGFQSVLLLPNLFRAVHMMGETRKALERVTIPILVVRSGKDELTRARNTNIVRRHVKTQVTELLLPQSRHTYTVSEDRKSLLEGLQRYCDERTKA